MSQYEFIDKRVPIALDNPSIYHDISKCKNCTLCRRACADVMSVLDAVKPALLIWAYSTITI